MTQASVQRRKPVSEDTCNRLLESALLLDLEVSLRGDILKIGAALGRRTFVRTGRFEPREALRELSGFAQPAKWILGHNLSGHDLQVIRKFAVGHPLLRLPVIDTLVLSPIAFPENPYHHLVKDYKLVQESVNDPVADARQAAELFRDELQSLGGLRQTDPELFEVLHYLLGTPETDEDQIEAGMAVVFNALGGVMPSRERTLELCKRLVRRHGCASVPIDASLVLTTADRYALAYALTWLRVAGTGSVLPPWVRQQHPFVRSLLHRLREVPCASPGCAYCRHTHDARAQLKSFFNWDDFRPAPKNPQGGSLQRDIVEAGMRDESLLAILPTGGGKSLCFQLPALVRNLRRGVLTIVISPLQALMKDQVEGLERRTGTPYAAALYGLLTSPERGDVLRRVRLGDIAVLYVSPEQLRNRSFRKAVEQREIGCWVFDEAHCLSKWGHDFRPDYLYAGRFIREFAQAQGGDIPAIACFTATAKREVKQEIVEYFKNETGRDLVCFEGGVERDNLRFQVQAVAEHGRLERVHELLTPRLAESRPGSAIVFRATRDQTEVTSEFLKAKGWKAAHFHAGLTVPEKKRIQEAFLGGEYQVICATNAFGMGIDKEDVRLVIHADTPGSLENYLQEAGRAGRDGKTAECVLLFDEADCEKQFRMGALSELSRRDIAQILRGLRRARHGDSDEVVVTPGEILRDEDLEISIDVAERGADTKVRTAVAWLERAGFLQRDENSTSVFQARLLVRDLNEARARMVPLNLSSTEQELWLAILRELMNASPTENLTVDRLAGLEEFKRYVEAGQTDEHLRRVSPEFLSGKILKILNSMTRVQLLKRDTLLSAFVRHKVADHSRIRLDRVVALDRKMVDLLATDEPDPEGWMPLSLVLLNQRLLDEGCESSIELLRALLKSLSEDGRGFAGTHGSIELKHASRDSYRVRVRRGWSAINELAEKRRRVASVVLDAILARIPAGTPAIADLLVEFSFEELEKAVSGDLLLRSELKDMEAALERALMYLHEQRVLTLQQGLAIFRSAMTIRLRPEARADRYKLSHYRPLEHHYGERVLQVHVMSEFARRGLERIGDALKLVLAYFTLDKESFIKRFLRTRPELLKLATTARSYQRIVTDLDNPAQIKVVTAPLNRNMLILAGPGSGKTRTVVHRCAYLLRVERVRPQSILVCCFNRSAAVELRRRLADLVDDDARGVTILTYHALAMRLLGYSFQRKSGADAGELNFDGLISDATRLLRGETATAGIEGDEVRDRLLSGFQHILVDEYQDIDQGQYDMISAIAGRTLKDPDQKLSILAVGDDDQNIYAFRGANVQFIRRFQQDYDAEIHYLVENYRSTRCIIETSNQLIAANRDRMKTEHPIHIDRHRRMLPAGGDFSRRDTLTGGRVQVVAVEDITAQAQAVMSELHRLRQLGVADWSNIAVLSSMHCDLSPVRSLAEVQGVPVCWNAGRTSMPCLNQIREIRSFLQLVSGLRSRLCRASDLAELAGGLFGHSAANPWVILLRQLLATWEAGTRNAELPVTDAIEFLYEACIEGRRDFNRGNGVFLSTVHAAKGTEFDHVLLAGPWRLDGDRARQEEQRRAFYVGMTRARKTLTVFDRLDVAPSLPAALTQGSDLILRSAVKSPIAEQGTLLNYEVLSLGDIHLGYPGQFAHGHQIHRALGALEPGDRLFLRRHSGGSGLEMCNQAGICVARLSHGATERWASRVGAIREVRVLAMVHRSPDQDSDPARRERCMASDWEVPVVELVCASSSRGDGGKLFPL